MSDLTTSAPQRHAISSEQMAQHEGLVRWVVRKQRLGNLPFPDALHEGRIGLWHALQGFDPSCGTAFSSYAVPAIARAVWHAVELSCPSNSPLSTPPSPQVIPLDPDDRLYTAEVGAKLHSLVEQLPPRLRHIIVAHYGLDHQAPQSFAAIGRSVGISRQRVHQLYQDAILWLSHPAHSLDLRRLTSRHSRSDYQAARRRQYELARTRRGWGRWSR